MRITVIGGANVDIIGRSGAPLVVRDSNPAHVRISPGGVGRNIAENLVRLGAELSFISALGDDRFAELLSADIAAAGLDSTLLIRRSGMNTGLYLALLEPGGNLFIAVNDMEAVESITPADIDFRRDLLVNSDLVIADANLRPDTLQAAARAAGSVPLMADSVSEAKADRLREILPRLEILKTNRAEAAVLAGFPLDTEAALREGCRKILSTGLRQLYITLGPQGACCAAGASVPKAGADDPETSEGGGVFIQPVLPGKVVNVNGAGDAFAAGAAFSYCLGNSVKTNGLYGAACAALTLESEDGVCKTLNRSSIEKRLTPINGTP